MNQKIKQQLVEKGYVEIFNVIEENGYQIDELDEHHIYFMDSLGKTHLCEYQTAEDIMKFTDKFIKMFLSYNDEDILLGMKNIQSVEDFDLLLAKHMLYNETDRCHYFTVGWKNIPNKETVYDLFKDCLSSNESNSLYNKLMQPALIKEVMKHNKKDTTENQELISLLDAEGYLTIYHGHITKKLENHNSWSIKKKVAERFGNRNALFNNQKEYYLMRGKVKLQDIITYIDDRNEFEVVVHGEKVKLVETETKKFQENYKDS